MGLFDRWRRRVSPPGNQQPPDYFGAYELSLREYFRVLEMSELELWETQPYLRTVVTFLARNIAQLGLHVYMRETEDHRPRVRDGDLARALKHPNSATTGFELTYGTVADLALYDRAFWLLRPQPDEMITRLPVPWVQPNRGDALSPETYLIKVDDHGHQIEVGADNVLPFHGWHPMSLQHGASPVQALRAILAEQVQAAEYRQQVWKRGGRVSSVLSRPADAPEWSEGARQRFRKEWQASYTGSGGEAGGTPILEDGMTLQRMDFSAHEQQYVEGARLALNTVAAVYHINPTMIGDLSNANYSNVREFRKMLYGDTLGPVIAYIQDRLNQFLVPRLDPRDGIYVEFAIEEKLRGNFEEQIAAYQTAVGRPWMTADEARARQNMPALGGDAEHLVTPLNVIVGGLSSPRDTAPPAGPVAASLDHKARTSHSGLAVKARADRNIEQQAQDWLARFFRRQGQAVRSRLGAGTDLFSAWDEERWDKELADDLLRIAELVTVSVAADVLDALGFDPGEYDYDRTLPFLLAVAERISRSVNASTHNDLSKAVNDPEDPQGRVGDVFANSEGSRAAQLAVTTVTAYSGFASVEAGSQVAGDAATKTWLTTSQNPRPSHARMHGETVRLDQPFSNGGSWPGDAGLPVDEIANCSCVLEIRTE